MNRSELIQAKSQVWAMRHRKPLQGSKGDHGLKNNTMKVEANLFEERLDATTVAVAGL